MRIHDAISGLFFMLLGAVVLAIASGFPKMPGQDVGPAMFPGATAALLVVFGLMLVVKSRGRPFAIRGLVALGPWASSPRHIMAALSIVLGCVAYILFSNRVGFLPLTALLLLVWHISLGVRPAIALLSAALTTLVVWGLFYKVLGVPLPWGVFKSYAF